MNQLATAKITNRSGLWTVEYLNSGSFLVGTQTFGNINAALKFCRLRALRVTECNV